jgi:hypothetical protein
MTTRRVLRGVINDLATSFVGRGNDFGGYWALGQLRSFADALGIQEITFDLLAGRADPASDLTRSVAAGYSAWLGRRLVRIGLPLERVRHARVVLKFGAYHGSGPPPQITRGGPFICSGLLIDDHGRRYETSMSSWCDQHDPSRELRRATERHGLGG